MLAARQSRFRGILDWGTYPGKVVEWLVWPGFLPRHGFSLVVVEATGLAGG